MHIIADSSTLYSPVEGKELGITIIPACAVVDGKVYRDFEDINSEEFLQLVAAGGVPTSSQPSIGDVLDVYEQVEDEILYLSIGDGLSGTYQTAVGAKNMMEKNEHIHVVDTKTLAGPQRYLVQKAMDLQKEGYGIEEIKEALVECVESSVSFVIPFDFDFLKRSGRLTPVAAKIGGLIKIVPVMTQTEDKRRITPFSIKRSKKKAVQAIMSHFESMGVNENYRITICHGGDLESAKEVFEQIYSEFSNTEMEILQLSPALITHGGPKCIVIQAVKK